MIGFSLTGFPRPVGSTYQQRQIMAKADRRTYTDHPVPWRVSIVRTVAGVFYEAKNHIDPQARVASDLEGHSQMVPEVLALARQLVDEPGWEDRTVVVCSVSGCPNPRPMWATGFNASTECLSCQTRTVLACVECGAPDECHFAHRERLLAESLCFYCDLWRQRLAEFADNQLVTESWNLCTVGDGRGPTLGFGGRRWHITYLDGREQETNDLWSGGQIPEWFRDRFRVTATLQSLPHT